MNNINDFMLSSYNFDLPEERIAQSPSAKRDESKLLVYKKNTLDASDYSLEDSSFKNIAKHLPTSSDGKYPLFVVNNSKVLPARLFGKSAHGGKRELLLLSPLPLLEISTIDDKSYAEAEVLLKPARNANIGDSWLFDGGLEVEILEKYEFGKHKVKLSWLGLRENLIEIFINHGHLPLPPYIKRNQTSNESAQKEQDKIDAVRYQTIYANEDKAGSVAAPTAGLHFTPELKKELIELGCQWEEVTLHVGYGTFTPVRAEDIREHAMHSEYFELSASTAQAILKAKQEKRAIIAVGTTSCRVLEGAAKLYSEQNPNAIEVFPENGLSGFTNIFLYPEGEIASKFKVINGLVTNFHLPESSLLMLVSSLVGRENLLKAYEHAIKEKYRFFSYGDAMFIL